MYPTRRRLRLAGLLAVAAGALVAPAASHAGVLTVRGDPICQETCDYQTLAWHAHYAEGPAAEANTVTVSEPPSQGERVIAVRDETAVVVVGETGDAECEVKSEHEVWCTVPRGTDPDWEDFWQSARLTLGALDDSGSLEGSNFRYHNDISGGSGSDDLVGSDSRDFLHGGPGSDTIDGLGAADHLHGGDGLDTITYASRGADAPVSVRLDGKANDGSDPDRNGSSTEAEEGDTDASIERAVGGAGPDRLVGSAAGNVLRGGPGDDVLDGGARADTLDGGDGRDTMTYAARLDGTPVAIRLDGGYNDGADPDGNGFSGASEEADRDISIENATGASGSDRLFGGRGVNVLLGSGGDDVIDGGLGGDLINGGSGSDTISYANRGGAVAVRLDGIRNDGADPDRSGSSSGSEEADLDYAIENAAGGGGPDLIRAQRAAASVLTGNGGDDRLYARDGGTTADTASCGDGTDSFQVDDVDVTNGCEVALP